MESFRRRLPPVNALVVFEAVARHLSFTQAARELGVSQAATSRQVRILEDHLGGRLFDRDRRRVRLTDNGEQLHAAVAMALGHIAATTDTLRRGGGAALTVATSVAFAAFWLIPRLARFHAAHPEVELRLISSDRPADWASGDVDVAVEFGDAERPGVEVHDLFGDEIFAVCAPAYLARRPAPPEVVDLTGETLLHLESDIAAWIGWPAWLERCGTPAVKNLPGPRFNNYSIVIQAALDGRGLALGWRRLIEPHLSDGRLVRVTAGAVVLEGRYVVIHRGVPEPRADARAFRAWIRAEASRDRS